MHLPFFLFAATTCGGCFLGPLQVCVAVAQRQSFQTKGNADFCVRLPLAISQLTMQFLGCRFFLTHAHLDIGYRDLKNNMEVYK